jgi:hypothetical protein
VHRRKIDLCNPGSRRGGAAEFHISAGTTLRRSAPTVVPGQLHTWDRQEEFRVDARPFHPFLTTPPSDVFISRRLSNATDGGERSFPLIVGATRYAFGSSRVNGCLGTWPAVPATALHRTVPRGKSRHVNSCKRWTPEGGVARNGRDDRKAIECHGCGAARTHHRVIGAYPLRQVTRTGAAPGSMAIVP